ncbi:MAG: hypothetical protein ACE141_06750 [Bryobacteraceae bacterium]
MRRLAAATAILICFLVMSAERARAAYVYGQTTLAFTSTQVSSYSYTELDYASALYYDAVVHGWLRRNGSIIRSGSSVGDSCANAGWTLSLTLYSTYLGESDHYVRAYYYEYIESEIWYEDVYGYSLMPAPQPEEGSDYGYPTMNFVLEYYEDYLGASTWLEGRAYPPVMGGINVIGSTMQGSSGYIEIYGADLMPWWGASGGVGISPSGVSFTYAYLNPEDPYQINIAYTIASNATPGTRNLTVTTLFGTTAPATFNVTAPPPTVQVTSASIPDDRITVVLAPVGVSGTLTVQVLGGTTHTVYQGSKSAGTHYISFDIPNLPVAEFTQVKATWAVEGAPEGTRSYHFKVLGTYHHTRYNSPAESSCTGAQSAVRVYNNSCVTTPAATMKSDFIFRVLDEDSGTGSGHSISYGDVLREAYCSPRDYPTARRNQTITGTLGPVSNSTVAACYQSELYSSGTQVYVHGVGVKTVTDRCPACCRDVTHLDHYTTSTACSGITSLPDAVTIRLY